MAAKSRAKWEHYCAEKDFTGRICDLATPTRARNAAGMDPSQAGTKGKAGQSSGSSTEASGG